VPATLIVPTVPERSAAAVPDSTPLAAVAPALKALMDVGEGTVAPGRLLGALRSVFAYERAALLANEAGALKPIATENVSEEAFAISQRALADLLCVRVLPAKESRELFGNSAGFEDNVLTLPVGIAGRAALVALALPAGTATPERISLARACSAVSMASILAHVAARQEEKKDERRDALVAKPALQDLHLLKMILDHLPISLTVQDSDGKFVLANAMAAADLAVSVETLLGSSPADFLSPDEAISRREWERSVIAGGKTIMAETSMRDHEGSRILLTSHTPVFITNNTLLVSSSVDITEHKETERVLTERAHIDKLTGLPDRVRIAEYTDSIIQCDHPQPLALAFIDLDNFKHVNDYYSHAVGDALLIKISERIKSKLQRGDMLARISGDEFVLLLCGHANKESVSALIEDVLTEVKKPFHLEGFEIFSSCSIGVSFYPAHGRNYETLRRNADGAMYGAKTKAKGQALYFDDGLGKTITARMEAEQRLRLAIRDHRFVCAFQPKVDIHTQEVVGFETLVRWRDSDGEIHPPGQFISLAIELGLINPITNFVLTETVNSIGRLDAAFGAGTSISINVGAKQASDLAFMSSLAQTIKESGHGERLIVELTEDAIVDNGLFQSQVLPSLRDLGVRISIDDFGTGYSSLSALADIIADEIKIDRSFISRIHERPRSQSVLKAIESLGLSLGMSMVAEGVETQEELIYLQTASRIRLAQGFYFSKPIYLDELNSGAKFGERVSETRVSAPSRASGRLMAPARAR
jgi:cyclic di-GMP phosphodiesterase Gmr